MTKKAERQPIKAENVAGGAGYILKEELIKGEQLGAHCKMFNEVTLKPGCEIGYHEHHGETETYYLTKGAGIYNDNGKEYPVEVGDVTFCADGNGHGIKNAGEEDLVFVALILKKQWKVTEPGANDIDRHL